MVMLHIFLASLLLSVAPALSRSVTTSRRATNDGIVLAVTPNCGTATGTVTDINEGVPALKTFKTIVAFGVRPISVPYIYLC